LEVCRERVIGGGYLVKIKKRIISFILPRQELSKLSFFASFDNLSFDYSVANVPLDFFLISRIQISL